MSRARLKSSGLCFSISHSETPAVESRAIPFGSRFEDTSSEFFQSKTRSLVTQPAAMPECSVMRTQPVSGEWKKILPNSQEFRASRRVRSGNESPRSQYLRGELRIPGSSLTMEFTTEPLRTRRRRGRSSTVFGCGHRPCYAQAQPTCFGRNEPATEAPVSPAWPPCPIPSNRPIPEAQPLVRRPESTIARISPGLPAEPA